MVKVVEGVMILRFWVKVEHETVKVRKEKV